MSDVETRASLDVLLVAADEAFARSLSAALEAADTAVTVRHTTSVGDAERALGDATYSVDRVVSCLPMATETAAEATGPSADAESFLSAVRRARPTLPVVQLLGLAGVSTAEAASRALSAGASDVSYWAEPTQPAALLTRLRLPPAVSRRDEGLLAEAVDALDDVFYVYDADMRLVSWNQRLNEVFELTDEELAGMAPTDFFLDADAPAVERAVAEALDRGETVVEARANTPAGVRVFELTGIRLTDGDGSVVGLCGVGRDSTDKRRREWQLARQNERLEQFARVVSHDLRNPLAVSKGYLDLASEACDSEHLERVEDALTRMDRIIDDVLTAARDGRIVDDARPVELEGVAREAWASVATGTATLRVEPTTVEADAERLQRLLENLFRNSVEHGSKSDQDARRSGDADAPSVTVSVGPLDGGFFVEDDGPGIALEDRERVFDPGVTTSEGGTGFGLNIVRTLAGAHGWRVRLTESASGGARFEFVESDAAGPEAAEFGMPWQGDDVT